MKKMLLGSFVAVSAMVSSASAVPLVPADFALLTPDASADIGTITGALLLLGGAILVAKAVIGFVRGR